MRHQCPLDFNGPALPSATWERRRLSAPDTFPALSAEFIRDSGSVAVDQMLDCAPQDTRIDLQRLRPKNLEINQALENYQNRQGTVELDVAYVTDSDFRSTDRFCANLLLHQVNSGYREFLNNMAKSDSLLPSATFTSDHPLSDVTFGYLTPLQASILGR